MGSNEKWRLERDSMVKSRFQPINIGVPKPNGSLENFRIGTEKIPAEVIAAFAYLKKSAAQANQALGHLDAKRCQVIGQACDEILAGKLAGNFPLAVWQTGSGTQSNMNLNEVIAHRGNELAGEALLHPNDHVNMSQSSNDTFPTAMHIAAVLKLQDHLLPALDQLAAAFAQLEKDNQGIVTTGRTHLQDAVPHRLLPGNFRLAHHAGTQQGRNPNALPGLLELALGGTAVGTGLNAPEGFDTKAAAYIAENTGHPFVTAPNKFHALTSLDAMVYAHGALKALAANLMKIANDVRWPASGPRDGLGEITIPANEPGSSIMPGKVNPTQCEAVTMVAVQVMGNDAAIGFAASQGNFQLNVFLPVTIYNFLQSVQLLTDVMVSFRKTASSASRPTGKRWPTTCTIPDAGYRPKPLHRLRPLRRRGQAGLQGQYFLKEAVLKLGYMKEEEFDKVFHPEEMV